jgi:hypothetical protein
LWEHVAIKIYVNSEHYIPASDLVPYRVRLPQRESPCHPLGTPTHPSSFFRDDDACQSNNPPWPISLHAPRIKGTSTGIRFLLLPPLVLGRLACCCCCVLVAALNCSSLRFTHHLQRPAIRNGHRGLGTARRFRPLDFDLPHHVHAGCDLAKDDVLAVQPGSWAGANKDFLGGWLCL